MTPSMYPVEAGPRSETDMTEEIQRVLAASAEPLTPSKIRAHLTGPYRSRSAEELNECLQRQAAAHVWYQYPKYRSQQDRYWDRAMLVHQTALVRHVLEQEPLPESEIRRKLPAYARAGVDDLMRQLVSQGLLHRHPAQGKRGRELIGLVPPAPRDYLRPELARLFDRLGQVGFTRAQLRAGAMELLHEEEWAPTEASEAGGMVAARPAQPESRTPETV